MIEFPKHDNDNILLHLLLESDEVDNNDDIIISIREAPLHTRALSLMYNADLRTRKKLLIHNACPQHLKKRRG